MTSTTTTYRSNRYAGPCFECGGRVLANDGTLEKIGAQWVVRHVACHDRAAAVDRAIAMGRAAKPADPRYPFLDVSDVCPRHGCPTNEDNDGICWECEAEALEAYRDRNEYR